MNLAEIVDSVRYRMNNYEIPYLIVDKEMCAYANQVINQMCFEALCLEDSTTASCCEISTVADQYEYSLSSSIIYVRDAKIVTEEVMIIDAPPATAWDADDLITGATSAKSCTIVEKITDYKYIVNKRTGTFTSGEIIGVTGTAAKLADQGTGYPTFSDHSVANLQKTTKNEMDSYYQGWRTVDANEPYRYLLDFNTGYITVYPKPDIAYILRLAVFRYPITAMTTTNMSAQTPEIDAKYHPMIIDGICAQAYLKNGENTYDPKKSANHFALYTKGMSAIKVKNNMFKGDNSPNRPHPAFI
jgi:hypothetical protein